MKVGDRITWKSQSQGSWTEKTGVIIAEIPAGKSAIPYVPKSAKKSHIKFDSTSGRDRVLVAVPAGKNGKITHYYCPSKVMLKMHGIY